MMKRILWVLIVMIVSTGTVGAQSLPEASALSTKPNKIESQIESILGESESEIMNGLQDAALNVANLAAEKILDEAMKIVADAAVLAPAAEKILSAYQKKKDKKLAKSIDKVSAVFKDGMERINKIRYQDLKIKVEHQEAMNETPGSIAESETKKIGDSRFTKLWDDHVSWIGQTTIPGTEKMDVWQKKYYDLGSKRHYASYSMFSQSTSLISDKLFLAKQKMASEKGKLTYLSPADRISFYREMNREAKGRSQLVKAYSRQFETALNQKRSTWTQQQLDQRIFRKPTSYNAKID